MRNLTVAFAVVSAVLAATACEPEIGAPCDPNQNRVLERVKVQAGTNDLVRDVSLESCSQALCASTNGSRPYCTKQCEADIECAEAGEGFTCQSIISFGQLACIDFTPANQCGPNGDGQGGFPCDCFTADGTPSDKLRKYCAASPETIAARDKEFGRPVFDPNGD